jgi:hypothetical protein
LAQLMVVAMAQHLVTLMVVVMAQHLVIHLVPLTVPG